MEPDEARRLTLLHGFTQTATSWDEFVNRWPTTLGAQFTALDLPGHGQAGAVRVDGLWGVAAWLSGQLDRSTVVGYSQGGRIALHLALRYPHLVERLVLIGATAGIDDPDERQHRRDSDDELATRIERIGTAAFIDEWLAQPLFATLTTSPDNRAARIRNRADNLAWALRTLGTGTQESLWHHLGEIACPTLLISGTLDTKFAALSERMAGVLPHARVALIDGAGHAAHLEQPAVVAQVIADWLAHS
jgi:2-succinyl-6-hydroxy-2,4-cyclohexadiene-1-carboxylate synthase